VVVTADGRQVLVAESTRYRITRYRTDTGASEVLVNLCAKRVRRDPVDRDQPIAVEPAWVAAARPVRLSSSAAC
jgi:hypothetical protein